MKTLRFAAFLLITCLLATPSFAQGCLGKLLHPFGGQGQGRSARFASCTPAPATSCQSGSYMQYRYATPQSVPVPQATPQAPSKLLPTPQAPGKTFGAVEAPAQEGQDPYGFVVWLNAERQARGLGLVRWHATLASNAQVNNQHQAARGLGHFFLAHRRQNAGMGPSSAIWPAWTTSPGHADALFDPSITVVGLAVDGPWQTFNAD